MPSRPDIREIASNVKDAFADADRETLLEVLTFVIKEYVVEGPPPMLIHQAETLADLQSPTFAQLIGALQTRFDHPELAMFVVDGGQVGVRIGGVVQPLLAARQPAGGAAAAEPPRPQPGVRVVESTLQQRPAPAPAPPPTQIPGTAPPPRGMSLRGQPTPTSGAAASPPRAQAPSQPAASPPSPSPPAATQPPGAAAPAPPSAAPEKPAATGDDASARFSLLELD